MNESNTIKINFNVDMKLVKRKVKEEIYLCIKRIFDILFSIVGLLLLSPIFLCVVIIIKLEDNGHAFFVQERIGKNGKIFKLYKFRSMVQNADEILQEMLKDPKVKNEYKKNMKLTKDPRITRIGNFIRKTSIDELPQLINVLKGEMSLIGNRPYLPREIEDIGEYYQDIIKTKPGITGYWQTSGRSTISFEERLNLESYYSNNMGLLIDIKIFFKTFGVVLFGKGAE